MWDVKGPRKAFSTTGQILQKNYVNMQMRLKNFDFILKKYLI